MLVTCPEPGVDQLVPVRISRVDCRTTGVCVEVDGGLSDGGLAALCALSSTPSPPCAGGARSGCESGDTQLLCSLGFATSRSPCLRCIPEDGGVADCVGGPARACTTSADCAPTLTCRDAGSAAFCYRP